jgi:hypothetical protein
MKRRINLFAKKKQEEPIPTLSMTVRSYGILFLCICVVLSLIAGGYYFYQLQNLNRLQSNLNDLQLLSQQNGKIQGNIVFFINKKEQLKTFLKDDNHFQEYYDLLKGTLKESNTDAILVNMDLTLTKDTNFVISLKDFATAQRLLDFIESPQFLENFEALSLESFSINNSQGSSDYRLSFRGKFVEKLETEEAAADQPDASQETQNENQ